MSESLKELIEFHGYSVNLVHSPEQAKMEIQKTTPNVLIIDELNLKGCYDYLFKEFPENRKKFHLIVLHYDNLKSMFPLADTCMSLPLFPDDFIKYLSSVDTPAPFNYEN